MIGDFGAVAATLIDRKIGRDRTRLSLAYRAPRRSMARMAPLPCGVITVRAKRLVLPGPGREDLGALDHHYQKLILCISSGCSRTPGW